MRELSYFPRPYPLQHDRVIFLSVALIATSRRHSCICVCSSSKFSRTEIMLPCFSARPPPSPIGRRLLRFVSAISMCVATTLVSAAPTIFLPDVHPQPNVQIAVEQSRDAQTKAALTTPSTSTLVVLRDETITSAIVPASGKALSDLANKDIVDDNARR